MQDIYSQKLSYEEILNLDLKKITFGEARTLVVKYGCKFKYIDGKLEIRIPFIEMCKIARRELDVI